MMIKTDYEKSRINITYLSKEEKKKVKEIRKGIKKLEKSLKEHLNKHRKQMILNSLEK